MGDGKLLCLRKKTHNQLYVVNDSTPEQSLYSYELLKNFSSIFRTGMNTYNVCLFKRKLQHIDVLTMNMSGKLSFMATSGRKNVEPVLAYTLDSCLRCKIANDRFGCEYMKCKLSSTQVVI
jgi:hypothetical protein